MFLTDGASHFVVCVQLEYRSTRWRPNALSWFFCQQHDPQSSHEHLMHLKPCYTATQHTVLCHTLCKAFISWHCHSFIDRDILVSTVDSLWIFEKKVCNTYLHLKLYRPGLKSLVLKQLPTRKTVRRWPDEAPRGRFKGRNLEGRADTRSCVIFENNLSIGRCHFFPTSSESPLN